MNGAGQSHGFYTMRPRNKTDAVLLSAFTLNNREKPQKALDVCSTSERNVDADAVTAAWANHD